MRQRLIRVLAKLLEKTRPLLVKNSGIHPSFKIELDTTICRSRMDRHSFCGWDVYCAEIGSFMSIANSVVIGGGRHLLEWVGMSPVFYEGRDSIKAKFSTHRRDPGKGVVIGYDICIGCTAIVLPGLSIGNCAVVGAGAVVTKSVPPYAILARNPAWLIRYRFDESVLNA